MYGLSGYDPMGSPAGNVYRTNFALTHDPVQLALANMSDLTAAASKPSAHAPTRNAVRGSSRQVAQASAGARELLHLPTTRGGKVALALAGAATLTGVGLWIHNQLRQ